MYDAKQAKEESSRVKKSKLSIKFNSIWEELVIDKFNMEDLIKDKVNLGSDCVEVEIPIYTKYCSIYYDTRFFLEPSKKGYLVEDLIGCLKHFGYKVGYSMTESNSQIKLEISW